MFKKDRASKKPAQPSLFKPVSHQEDEPEEATYDGIRYIGPLTEQERLSKVQHYLNKKRNKANSKKFSYKCRKQVAEKRLRIKGRFVTKQ